MIPFHFHLKKLREERMWTQEFLAKKMKVHTSRIAQYEVGSTTPSLARIHQFAHAFDIDVHEFEPLTRFRTFRKWEGVSKTQFGQIVYEQRKKLHLTRIELGTIADIDPVLIGAYERGDNAPRKRSVVVKLSQVLQIDSSILLSVWESSDTRRRIKIIDGKKLCPICKEMKPTYAFHKNQASNTGLHSYCITCRELKRKGKV